MSELVDYSALENEVLNSPDPEIIPKGTEVKARIMKVNTGISPKYDAKWYSVVFDVPDRPMAIPFSDFMWDISESEKLTPDMAQRNRTHFKNFVKAFKIDLSKPFSWTDDLPGLQGWVIVGIKNNEEYGDQNTVSKFVVGK